MSAPAPPWPATRKVDVVDTLHGRQVADPYRWLEDERSDEVQAWMKAQDEAAHAALDQLPDRAPIEARLKELFYYDAVGAPVHYGGRYFYSRKHAAKEKTIVYWKEGEHGAERVLFDPNTWSADGSTGLGDWTPSWDGTLVAYAVKEHNSDESVTKVLEVATGTDRPDVLTGTKYASASWTPDSRGFYYTYVPPISEQVTVAARPGFAELRLHHLGAAQAEDEVVHERTGNPETFLGGGVSRDGHWLMATVQHGWNSSDVFVKDARDPKAPWAPLVTGVDAMFHVMPWRDQLYVLTNEGAPRYRVYKVDPRHLDRAGWRELVAEGDATLEGLDVVGEHLILTYLRQAHSELEVRDLEGQLIRKVALPGLGTSSGIVGHCDEDTGYFAFTSFTEPQVIYKTSIKSGAVEEWTRIKLPVDTSGFVTDQVFYPSKDGTLVSMFIIHRKDARRDGANPTLLYGYGGFNVNLTPAFAGSRAVWLEQGGVYAIPNLRGGGEYGEAWHKDGMLLQKQHVFDDFIAAAEHLIKEGWTAPAHLAISGGSNGGLLVGATMAQRPELFKAVVCSVPLLDMLRYHLFGSGKTWVPEYGSADDATLFEALWAYSPYRRVIDDGPRPYPALLMESADHDDRVDPLHARKLVAAVQAAQRGAAPVLLRIERNAGHGGADQVKATVARMTDQLAFLLAQLR
jgi:prolyl oligopeptidase